jgi:hypothetical protein
MYPEEMIRPMREEPTNIGFREMRTPEEVDAVLKQEKRTVLVVVNSHLWMRRRQGPPSSCQALSPRASRNSGDGLRRAGSGSHGSGAKLLHRLWPVFPVDQPDARWEGGIYVGERQHRGARRIIHR